MFFQYFFIIFHLNDYVANYTLVFEKYVNLTEATIEELYATVANLNDRVYRNEVIIREAIIFIILFFLTVKSYLT